MNEDKNFILYEWNNETKEFYFLGHKIDYVHNPSEWQKYLNDLVTENKDLREKIDEGIKYNKELSKLYDIGSMEYSNATTNLLILGDKETRKILKGEDNE